MGIFDIFKKKKKHTNNLVFKSNDGAYEYTQKFFSKSKIQKKALIYGLVYVKEQDDYCLVKCTHDEVQMIVFAEIKKNFPHKIKSGDFVEIGILDVGILFTMDHFLKKHLDHAGKSQKEQFIILNEMMKEMTIARVVRKVSKELDLTSGQFLDYT